MQEAKVQRHNNQQAEMPAATSWLDGWTVRSPIAQIDRYLVLLRWGVILAVGIPSLFGGFQGQTLVPPLAAVPAIVAYNLPVSFYVWRRQPVARGRAGWLLIGDLLQSTAAVVLTGGYQSFFFVLFLLVMTEMALAFPWRMALALVVSIDALQMGVTAFYQTPNWEPFAAYIVVSKFIISLIVGGVVTLFSELVRREDTARRAATHAAARIAALNAIFLRLGESALDLERILATVLDSTRALPDVAFSLVLLPDDASVQWRVTASNTDRHPVGEQVAGLDEGTMSQPLFSAGAASAHPLPPFVANDGINQLVGVYLPSPYGETLGALVVGRRSNRLLNGEEQAFLQSLALEAGLALRNARLYAQEREHVARLQHFEALQSTFFAAISHELKTPLVVLKMLVPSLRQLPDLPSDTRAEITETIEENLSRLESLITDLLESARLEAGAVALHPRPVDLGRLIQRVLEDLAPLLARKKQQWQLQGATVLPRVWADSRRVEQILSNLVGNAAKFAPPESTIELSLSRVEDAVQVCVADAGPGVPPEERERIFDKFYIAIENEALAGVGLGLFVCRELVRLHGGRIWVEARPGGGSRFCFTLPLAREEETYGESYQENPGYR